MKYQNISDVQKYLSRFDEILCQMATKMLSSDIVNNITIDFVVCMIPHHEGTIAMCENLLQYCIDPRLKDVADSIIKEQSEGVRQLKEIREKLCEN